MRAVLQDWLVDAGFGGKGLIDPLPVCQMAGFRTKHGLVTDCNEHSVPGETSNCMG